MSIEETLKRDGAYIVSEGTLRSQDLLPKFLGVLEELNPEAYQGAISPTEGFAIIPADAEEDPDSEWWDGEDCALTFDMVLDTINGYCPDGYYFGTQEGDGACYGFFPNDVDRRTTGEKQQALAEIIVEYAAILSHGELRAAIRLGKADIFDQTCIFCDAKLEPRCSNPECPSNKD